MAYNPSKPPPAPTGLRVSAYSAGIVNLDWNAIGNYPFLTGYQVSLLVGAAGGDSTGKPIAFIVP